MLFKIRFLNHILAVYFWVPKTDYKSCCVKVIKEINSQIWVELSPISVSLPTFLSIIEMFSRIHKYVYKTYFLNLVTFDFHNSYLNNKLICFFIKCRKINICKISLCKPIQNYMAIYFVIQLRTYIYNNKRFIQIKMMFCIEISLLFVKRKPFFSFILTEDNFFKKQWNISQVKILCILISTMYQM